MGAVEDQEVKVETEVNLFRSLCMLMSTGADYAVIKNWMETNMNQYAIYENDQEHPFVLENAIM